MPAPDRFVYANGELRSGPHRFPLTASAAIVSGRVSLTDSGKFFSFGPGRLLPSASPSFEFASDPGDTVRFTHDEGPPSLLWTKRSRATLEIRWSANSFELHIVEAADLERAAVQYLTAIEHWEPAEYHLEDRGPAADGLHEILLALHRDDRDSPYPGAGRSVELHVSYDSRQVTHELAAQ
jgi:hypothetical protein